MHRLELHPWRHEKWKRADGTVMVGHRCTRCLKLTHIQPASLFVCGFE